jgi:hypothetical protein
VNVRDLGGLPARDGGETRFGVVVRADSIRGLTARGWSALVEYGVERAIDLRADHELAEDPDGDAPIPVDHIPIDPWQVREAHEFRTMRDGYVALLDHFQRQFARAVETVAEADGATVVHCAGGRDRTGLTVALMLALAGVDPETIAADHALSDESWAPYTDAWFAAAETEEERERRRRVAAPAGRTMVTILDELDERFGGPRAYLTGGGASRQNIDRLVVRFRRP